MNGIQKTIHWTPRIISVLAIIFVSLFALDAFHADTPVWRQVADFFIHLIPSFILIGLLILAWRWPLLGGVIIALIGLVFSPIIFIHNYNMNHSIGMSLSVILMITFPFILAGILFILDYFRLRKSNEV
ncbi:MAG: hypothetical protein JXA77_10555 [Bacteroidales bacterium]|nr:hypothetical protein [Bacteroidales bacterium]MBN2820516.1 hypothetical protein [Bacteroidales bacterium]